MANGINFTGWYDGDQRPARPGVYQRQMPHTDGFLMWAHWNGKRWGLSKLVPRLAVEGKVRSKHQRLPWRGLTEEIKL